MKNILHSVALSLLSAAFLLVLGTSMAFAVEVPTVYSEESQVTESQDSSPSDSAVPDESMSSKQSKDAASLPAVGDDSSNQNIGSSSDGGIDSASSSSNGEGSMESAGESKISSSSKGQTGDIDLEKSKEPPASSTPIEKSSKPNPVLGYQAHVANIGWQSFVNSGSMAGTTGKSLRLEALRIKLSNVSGGISYQAHVSNIGWQSWVNSNDIAGTVGRSLAVEAIKIKLTGEVAEDYDIYYRVHVANLGWLGWAKNGESAGSVGQGLAMEAIEIRLVDKSASFSGYGADSPFSESMIAYSGHVSNIGWQSRVSDGSVAGTTGRSLGLEALSFKNASTQTSGSVVGQAYVEHCGWQQQVADGTIGTTGQSLPMQAVKFSLSGSLSSKYDIYYRVHVSNVGWMGWCSNGAAAGSLGFGRQIEAIQIRLVSKGASAPGNTSDAFESAGLNYQSHSQDYGWMTPVAPGQTAGTVGKSKRLEAVDISLGNLQDSGSVKYQVHVSGVGWMDWVSDGATAGTTGQSRAIEAVKIALSGDIANRYDIYYRVHSENFGWLDWAKDGEIAGTTGCSFRAEALQIKLVSKGSSAPGSTAHPSYALSYSYKVDVRGAGWQGSKTGGIVAGTTGKGIPIERFSASLNGTTLQGTLQYSLHSADVGWQDWTNAGNDAGVAGKQLEGIRIRLTGDLASYFDVWYCVHSENFGWMGWAKNGASAGTSKIGYRAEAVRVLILPKGSSAPGSTARPYRESTHVNQAVRRSDGAYDWYNGSGVVDRNAAINKIMGTARSLLGVPYVWLGVYPKDGGMDCASFTWYLYKQLGIDIGFETYDQMYSGKAIGSIADAKPGDLILMYNGAWPNYNPLLYEHVVLYAGNGMIYEEPTFGGHCQYVSLFSKGASNIRIRRIIG